MGNRNQRDVMKTAADAAYRVSEHLSMLAVVLAFLWAFKDPGALSIAVLFVAVVWSAIHEPLTGMFVIIVAAVALAYLVRYKEKLVGVIR